MGSNPHRSGFINRSRVRKKNRSQVIIYPYSGIAYRSSSGVPYSRVKPNFKNTTPCIIEIRGLEYYSPDTFDRDLYIAYKFEVNFLILFLLTFINLLTYIYYIKRHKIFINNIKDRREFIMSKKRLITNRKDFIIDKREYITVYKSL